MNEHLDRAEWQRGEGMILFTHMVEHAYPKIEQAVTDDEIIERLEDMPARDRTSPFEVATAIGDRVSLVSKPILAEASHFNGYISSSIGNPETIRFNTMTHSASPYQTAQEAFNTVTTLPLNILELANRQAIRERRDTSIYGNLGRVATVIGSDWFAGVMNTAALTKNNYWGGLSVYPVRPGQEMQAKCSFDMEPDGDYLSFDFDSRTKQQLLQRLGSRNHDQRSGDKTIDPAAPQGTSSGCPVRHYRPTPAMPDEQLDAIATKLKIDKETLLTQRPENGIEQSLAMLSRILMRTAEIQPRLF